MRLERRPPALSSRPAVRSPRVVERELRALWLRRGDDLRRPRGAGVRRARRPRPGAGVEAARTGVDLLPHARTWAAAARAADALAGAIRRGAADRGAFEVSLRRVLPPR
jgi:hypothetical protein